MTSPHMAYRETAARGATALRLVIMLYEQLIQDLTKAAQAIDKNDIESRANCINHAVLVIAYLQSPLDFANGGKVARELEKFYNALRQNLVQVQFFPTKAGINQLITDVLAVREAWIEVERTETALIARVVVAPAPGATAPGSNPSAPGYSEPTKWQG
jgi:flagellar biosynthetic protein FliS